MEILFNDAGFSGAAHARECFDVGEKVIFIDTGPQIEENIHNNVLNGLCLYKYGSYFFNPLIMYIVELFSCFNECFSYRLRLNTKITACKLVPATYITLQNGDL